MGSQTALAPISLGASILDIVQVLGAHCTSEEIDELVTVSISPCTDLLRRITSSHLSGLFDDYQETSISRAAAVQFLGHQILGLQSDLRASRAALSVLYRTELVSWAARSSSSLVSSRMILDREAELTASVARLEAAFDAYSLVFRPFRRPILKRKRISRRRIEKRDRSFLF